MSEGRGGVDFDLHGHVGVRLLDASAADRSRVKRQLGPIEAPLTRNPDITIRFVDRLGHGPLTHVSLGETAFDDRSFIVLRGHGRRRAKARLPFEQVGAACTVECERGLPSVPLLVALVNVAAVSRGVLPLHASAFVHDGRGVLVTGWAKGGKTEALLAFMRRGASYVGDEWVYLTDDGTMFGIPEPMRLWRWQLQQLPELAERVPRTDRLRMALIDALASTLDRLATARYVGPVAAMRRTASALSRQVNVQVPPGRLFGHGRITNSAAVDAIVFVSSHDAPDTRIEVADAGDVARRMAASLAHERRGLMEAYGQSLFAFPDRRSAALDTIDEAERALLTKAFAGRRVAWLRHPYPCDVDTLFDPIAAFASAARP